MYVFHKGSGRPAESVHRLGVCGPSGHRLRSCAVILLRNCIIHLNSPIAFETWPAAPFCAFFRTFASSQPLKSWKHSATKGDPLAVNAGAVYYVDYSVRLRDFNF